MKHTSISQVQNYGVSGLGIVHYLQMYKYYVRKHLPDIIFIIILDQNDIRNSSPDLEYNADVRPNYHYDKAGNVIGIGPFVQPSRRSLSTRFRSHLAKYSAFYRLASLTKRRLTLQDSVTNQMPIDAYIFEEPWNEDFDRAWKYSMWALKALVNDIRDDSAIPFIVLVPSKWTTSETTWHSLKNMYQGEGYLNRNKVRSKLGDFTSAMAIEFLDLTDKFREAYETGEQPHWDIDGHLTAEGHSLVADAIYQKLRDDVIFMIDEK